MQPKGESKEIRKCKKCVLDCVVVRSRTMKSIPDSQRAEYVSRFFNSPNPVYNRTNCPKNGKNKNNKKSLKKEDTKITNGAPEPPNIKGGT